MSSSVLLEVFGLHNVSSYELIEELNKWQDSLGYELSADEICSNSERYLNRHFRDHLANLPEERFASRPVSRRGECQFVVWMTELERAQFVDAIKRSLSPHLRVQDRRRRRENGNVARPIVPGVRRAIAENWCAQMWCTTCGSYRLRLLFLGEPDSRRAIRPRTRLSLERAHAVVAELREIDGETPGFLEPVMAMLYWIWSEFQDRAHEEIFPALQGSWAGTVLEDMKAHYRGDQLRRAQNQRAQRDLFY